MAKQKYAVIGHPIGHTMSPFIQTLPLKGISALSRAFKKPSGSVVYPL